MLKYVHQKSSIENNLLSTITVGVVTIRSYEVSKLISMIYWKVWLETGSPYVARLSDRFLALRRL